MNGQASPVEMNQFVRVVDDFMREYARLTAPVTQQKVAASGDAELQREYRNAVNRGASLKGAIENTVGAWQQAKAAWAGVTDQTSMAIGDAIDTIRSWFGYDPAGGLNAYRYQRPAFGLGALGVVQLPAAAWVAGIIATAYVLLRTFRNLMIRVDAAVIQRNEPGVSRDEAIARASRSNAAGGGLFSLGNAPLLLGSVFALYWLFSR